MKQTHERLQSGANRPGSLVGRPPRRPTGQWPLHNASSCKVHSLGSFILVEFQFSLKFVEMLQFGTYVPKIK
jgi:hypothetical protein